MIMSTSVSVNLWKRNEIKRKVNYEEFKEIHRELSKDLSFNVFDSYVKSLQQSPFLNEKSPLPQTQNVLPKPETTHLDAQGFKYTESTATGKATVQTIQRLEP